ncbi:hypothetical protein JL722_13257 [Aureococcus anophagefferens]|nr:hypothetical protein JL722_13257 [Aureococcus anophagefferens]
MARYHEAEEAFANAAVARRSGPGDDQGRTRVIQRRFNATTSRSARTARRACGPAPAPRAAAYRGPGPGRRARCSGASPGRRAARRRARSSGSRAASRAAYDAAIASSCAEERVVYVGVGSGLELAACCAAAALPVAAATLGARRTSWPPASPGVARRRLGVADDDDDAGEPFDVLSASAEAAARAPDGAGRAPARVAVVDPDFVGGALVNRRLVFALRALRRAGLVDEDHVTIPPKLRRALVLLKGSRPVDCGDDEPITLDAFDAAVRAGFDDGGARAGPRSATSGPLLTRARWPSPPARGGDVTTIEAAWDGAAVRFAPRRAPAAPARRRRSSFGVARGHGRDGPRNAAFREAIARVVPAAVIRAHAQRRRALVVDYGAGTGLLSLMAAKAARSATPDIAAPRILGVEKDADLAAVAERVILDNGERVEVVVGDAGELGAGLPLDERGDALLVEMFDCGGLGERVLHFVGQAWRHALRPDAEVVPRSCVYRPETVVEGGAWVALTAPATVAAFDLGDRAAFVGDDSPERGGAASVAWTATRSGVVAGVLSWFVLDCDDESSLTTLPPALGFPADAARTAAHWPAALQPLDRRRLDVGEAAALAATHRGTRVAFAWARDPRPAPGDDLWRVLNRAGKG